MVNVMNKLMVCFGVIVSFCSTSIGGLMADSGTNPVLPPRFNMGDYLGKKMGEGFERGYEDQMRRNEIEADNEMRRNKEQANSERRRNEMEANNARLAVLLEGYTPARHSEYVLRIMQSNLPQDLKQQTIQQLDSIARRAG